MMAPLRKGLDLEADWSWRLVLLDPCTEPKSCWMEPAPGPSYFPIMGRLSSFFYEWMSFGRGRSYLDNISCSGTGCGVISMVTKPFGLYNLKPLLSGLSWFPS